MILEIMEKHHNLSVGRFALGCGLAVLFSAISVNHASAQETGSFMRNPADAVTLSLAGAGVVSADGLSVLDNAALTPFSRERISAEVTMMPWMPKMDGGLSSYSAAVRYGSRKAGTFYAGVRTAKSSPFELADDDGNVLGESSAPFDMAVEAGWAYPFLKDFSASAAVRYLRLAPGYGDAAGAVSFDAGFGYRHEFRSAGPLSDVSAIVQMKDFGTSPDYGYGKRNLPWTVNAGVSAGLAAGEKHLFRAGASVDVPAAPKLSSGIEPVRGAEASFGAEYSFSRMLYLRAGYHLGDRAAGGLRWGSAGVGIHLWKIAIDAGFVLAPASSPLRGTYSCTISCRI